MFRFAIDFNPAMAIIGRMEELLANATPGNRMLYAIIGGLLLGGGAWAAYLLIRHNRRNPPNRKALTNWLVRRAWNTPEIGTVLATLLLLYVLASFSGSFFYADQIPAAQLAIALAVNATVLTLIAILGYRRGNSWKSGFGMGFRQLAKLRFAPLFYLATLPALLLATQASSWVLELLTGKETELQKVAQVMTEGSPWLRIAYALVAIVVAPLFEEIMFRGLLFPYLVKRNGLVGGTAMVSLIFAAMHFHLPSFIPLALLSVGLCLAYWRTGSLWVSIGMHALFNTVSILSLNLLSSS